MGYGLFELCPEEMLGEVGLHFSNVLFPQQMFLASSVIP